MSKYIKPTVDSIIKELLFSGYEFKTKTIFAEDLKDGDLFKYKNNYYIKTETVIKHIPLIEVFNLQSHQFEYAQLKNPVQKIEICFKM